MQRHIVVAKQYWLMGSTVDSAGAVPLSSKGERIHCPLTYPNWRRQQLYVTLYLTWFWHLDRIFLVVCALSLSSKYSN